MVSSTLDGVELSQQFEIFEGPSADHKMDKWKG